MHPGASSINSISLWMFSCQKSLGYKEKGEHTSESRQVLSLINDPCFGFCIPQVQQIKHRVIVNLVQMTDEHSTNASVTCRALLFPFLLNFSLWIKVSNKPKSKTHTCTWIPKSVKQAWNDDKFQLQWIKKFQILASILFLTRLTYQGFPDLSHRYLDLLRVQTWTPMNSLFFFRFSKLAGILLFCLQKQHIKHQRTYGPTAVLSTARLFNNSFYLWVIMDWHFLGV